jgi:SAM-dependent methyltransferase
MIPRAQFEEVYQAGVGEVMARMPNDWSAFARHNIGWRKGHFDAEGYLRVSVERYWRAYGILCRSGAQRVLDVGGFLAAFPLALQRIGMTVAIAERYDYYGTSMDAIAAHLRDHGVEVIDMDFTDPAADVAPLEGRFDAVTCMAVAEHLPHSPRILMDNLRVALRTGGALAFEVPNIVFWPKRYAFFVRGETVLAPIAEVYRSAIPFTGHHREYTFADARYVVREAGFEIVDEQGFNYGFDTRRLLNRMKYAPALLAKTWSEVILLHCRKPSEGKGMA